MVISLYLLGFSSCWVYLSAKALKDPTLRPEFYGLVFWLALLTSIVWPAILLWEIIGAVLESANFLLGFNRDVR